MDRQHFNQGTRSGVLLAMLAVVALALAGCAGITSAGQSGPAAPAAQATPAPAVTVPAAEPANSSLNATPLATAPASTAAAASGAPREAAGPATVKVAEDPKFGPMLVDEKGMTLYLFTKDQPNTSNCYDKCATAWPPLLTKGSPVAQEAADQNLIGSTSRKDDTQQVTYNGWPLYYYFKDQKPGDVTGQGVGGVWYLVSPKGEKIEAAPVAGSSGVQAKTINVTIKNFSFGQPLTVPVGTTVVWTNQDDMSHTVTARDGSFDSGELEKGATFKFTFNKEGTFDYSCSIHPSMQGVVVVTK